MRTCSTVAGEREALRDSLDSLCGCTCATVKLRYGADTTVVGKCDDTWRRVRVREVVLAHLLCSIACLSKSAAVFGLSP